MFDPTRPVEIVAIGTEVVIGRIQDTNSSWLADRLTRTGAVVERITAVADEPYLLRETLQSAVDRRVGLVLGTGGLGPTPDDLTVETVAELARRPASPSEKVMATYRQRRGLSADAELPPHLYKMSSVPLGAQIFENQNGWAPGFAVNVEETVLGFMPGPPREMKSVFASGFEPLISAWYGGRTESTRVLVTMFESEISPILGQIMARHENAYLKAYVALGDREVGLPVDVIVRRQDKGADIATVLAEFEALVAAGGANFRPLPDNSAG